MSAYMMNPEDHALLGAYLAHKAGHYGVYNPVLKERVYNDVPSDNMRACFFVEVLAEANQASVNHRYRENEECDEHIMNAVQMLPCISALVARAKPAKIYDLACSLNYQSCEHPDWVEWHAHWMINDIKEYAARDMAKELNDDPEPEIPAAYVN